MLKLGEISLGARLIYDNLKTYNIVKLLSKDWSFFNLRGCMNQGKANLVCNQIEMGSIPMTSTNCLLNSVGQSIPLLTEESVVRIHQGVQAKKGLQ